MKLFVRVYRLPALNYFRRGVWQGSKYTSTYDLSRVINGLTLCILIINIIILSRLPILQTFLTAQKMKFSIKDFFSKCDQIPRKLRVWSYLLKKSLLENFIFWAVSQSSFMNSWQGPE